MPIYVAVRCFSCEMFQVIQKPKSNKFNCRVCNEKQSVRKLYCKSDKAKDCRLVVQQYNKKHGEMIREARTGMFQENLEEQEFDRSEEVNSSYHHTGASGKWNILYQKKSNQWEEYLSDSDDHGNNFLELLLRTTKRHKSMYSRYRNRNVRKSDRNASDDLLILLAHLQKEEKFHTSLIVEVLMESILT